MPAKPAVTAPAVAPLQLLKRWVVDYFNDHNDVAAREFVAPEYTLTIGDVVFAGRDEQWLPAVAQQMKLFPTLAMTVHQTLAGDDWVAASFSEHGTSEGLTACWSGIAIYRSAGDRLVSCVAQEDYVTRHRQMKSRVADPVEPSAVAPWHDTRQPSDDGAEAVVRSWLTQSWPPVQPDVRCDDEHITGVPMQFEVKSSEIDTLYSSGPNVAFHVRQTGTYVGGLPGLEPMQRNAVLHCNGIVRVVDGVVRQGRVIRDRFGLRASLKKMGVRP